MRLSWIAIVIAVLAYAARRPTAVVVPPPPQVIVVPAPAPTLDRVLPWRCPPNGPCFQWAPCMATDAGCWRY